MFMGIIRIFVVFVVALTHPPFVVCCTNHVDEITHGIKAGEISLKIFRGLSRNKNGCAISSLPSKLIV
jgi:hypothetical protein